MDVEGNMAVSMNWVSFFVVGIEKQDRQRVFVYGVGLGLGTSLFPSIAGPFCGCPCDKSPTTLRSIY